ncbi:hypothetical protein OCAE111667_14270 [Occultella aeris]|uniref:Uncharacterized protein n=1 Tax=Occultella aeris TaxID=2761496 RepID=A0A7M4DIS3_9MICO|nr:hypothetical protein [Occultella aeris]VZO36886.1 hypothetical protein HALOF300_02026 [Occultella aeris]
MYTNIEGEASAVPASRRGARSTDGAIDVEFQGWLGDDLLDLVDRWIVSARLADALRASDLTGYHLAPVQFTKHPDWALMKHEFELPERWERLVPTGERRDGDDFATEPATGLMASGRALELLRSFRLEQAELSAVTAPVHGSDAEAAAAEAERLARVRALDAENQKAATIERAERQRAADEHAARREARIAEALVRHRVAHGEPVEPTGDLDVIRAGIGKPLEDERVAAVLALASLPLEIEVTRETKRERLETHASPDEGFEARFKNGRLERVVLFPRGRRGAPYPRSRDLIHGFDFSAATPWDVVEALGEPGYSKWGARGTLEYVIGRDTLHLGFLRDLVDAIVVLRKKQRRV